MVNQKFCNPLHSLAHTRTTEKGRMKKMVGVEEESGFPSSLNEGNNIKGHGGSLARQPSLLIKLHGV